MSRPEWWTPSAWAARAASGNPVFPYEWAVLYQGGGLFRRVCQGTVRTSRDAPLERIRALRITGPGAALEIPAPPGPVLEIVVRATVIGQLGDRAACGIARWTFGFRDAAGFWGIVLDPAGRHTPVQPLEPSGDGRGLGMTLALVLLVTLALVTGCEETSDNAKSTTGPTITVHCDAQAPSDTTAKITCPGGTP